VISQGTQTWVYVCVCGGGGAIWAFEKYKQKVDSIAILVFSIDILRRECKLISAYVSQALYWQGNGKDPMMQTGAEL